MCDKRVRLDEQDHAPREEDRSPVDGRFDLRFRRLRLRVHLA